MRSDPVNGIHPHQLTMFDEPTEPAAPRVPRNAIRQLRDEWDHARAIALGRIETARDAVAIHQAIGRLRERMVAFEVQLSDLARAMGNLVRRRADSVRSEVETVQRVVTVLGEFLGPVDLERLRRALTDAGLAGVARAMADPADLTAAMQWTDEDDETTALVAGLIHGWRDDGIDNDPDLDGIDVEAD